MRYLVGFVLLLLALGTLRLVGCGDERIPCETSEECDDNNECTDGAGLPLALALDDSGNAWVLGEFHTHLQYFGKASPCPTRVLLEVPHHALARPFWSGAISTQRSALGESVVCDSNDDIVWFSQGGAYLEDAEINHSRVVSYDPGTGGAGGGPEGGTFKAYNLPGDRNEAMGLYWDQARNWIWAAESGFWPSHGDDTSCANDVCQGSIIAFDPDTAKFDNDWLWEAEGTDPDLSDELCWGSPGAGGAGGGGGWSTPDDGCFKRYALRTAFWDAEDAPEVAAFGPAHIVVDSGGFVWFTNFWGSSIGRLDPATEVVTLYPLKAHIGQSTPAASVGPGPWEIRISPDGNYVVWNEYFDSTLSRMPIARWDDAACQALDGGGDNPCVEEMLVPVDLSEQLVHSIEYDADGRLWFTQDSTTRPAIMANSIGFVTPDWSQIVLLAPTEFTPNFNPSANKTYTGIAIDPGDGEIWVNEFLPQGVGRLALE